MSLRGVSVANLYAMAQGGDRRALGRLLTLVERGGDPADEVTELTFAAVGEAHTVGITGAPGSGKSTLTGRLVATASESGRRPAVIAVDPSSPLTGGAILGDRIRMDHVAHPDTFIRSMATRGHSGGLAIAVPGAIRVLDAVGYDPVIVETVGVGQVEVDVASTADSTVVVVTPGWGDAVQANKAGLLELGDVFVVNKADRPGANDARRDLDLMLDLSHISGADGASSYRPPIVMTTATDPDGHGIKATWQAIASHFDHLRSTGLIAQSRGQSVRAEIQRRVLAQVEHGVDALLTAERGAAIVADAIDRDISPAEASKRIGDHIQLG